MMKSPSQLPPRTDRTLEPTPARESVGEELAPLISILAGTPAVSRTVSVPAELAKPLPGDARAALGPPARIAWQGGLPEYEALLRQGAIDWLDLRVGPGVTLVKRNDQRTVWRIERGGADLFVKVYRPRGLAARLKLLLRGHVAAQEAAVGRYAAAHQLATVRTIACGWPASQPRSGPSFLVTETVRDAEPLSEFWLKVRDQPRNAWRLIDVVARLVARAHQIGFHHCDMHSGNILVRPRPGEEPEALFVDLHDVAIGRRVPTHTIVANIAQLNQWFRRHATRTQRLRFLDAYLRYRELFATASRHARNWHADRRQLLADLDRQAAWHAEQIWSKRDRRTRRDGRYFCRLRPARGWRALALRTCKHPRPGSIVAELNLDRLFWQEALANPEQWYRDPALQMVKDSHTATVWRGTLQVGDQSVPVMIKRPRPRSWSKRVAQWIGPSRSRHTWDMANRLMHRDLFTAQPLAVLERRAAGLIGADSFVIVEAVDNDGDLETYLSRRVAALPPAEQRLAKDAVIETLVRLIREFHTRGFEHRDFKASNLLLCKPRDPKSPYDVQLILVDLDGVNFVRLRPRRDAMWRALVRLNASLSDVAVLTRTDRARLLKRLLSEPGRDAGQWREHWQQLQRGTQLKLEAKARRREWKLKHYGRE